MKQPNTPTARPATRAPARRPTRAEAEAAEWRRAGWTIFWFLVAGKAGVMVAVLIVGYQVRSSPGGLATLLAASWAWLLPLAALALGPAAFWWRLRRVRRRRAALLRAEWRVG